MLQPSALDLTDTFPCEAEGAADVLQGLRLPAEGRRQSSGQHVPLRFR
jgi:hypothetical protein